MPVVLIDYLMFFQVQLLGNLGSSTRISAKQIDWSRLVFSDELDHYLGDIYTSNFIAPLGNSYNTSNLALGTVLTYHIKRGAKSRRFHLPIDLDVEMGLAVHNFIRRSNGFINDIVDNNRKYTLHGSCFGLLKEN